MTLLLTLTTALVIACACAIALMSTAALGCLVAVGALWLKEKCS